MTPIHLLKMRIHRVRDCSLYELYYGDAWLYYLNNDISFNFYERLERELLFRNRYLGCVIDSGPRFNLELDGVGNLMEIDESNLLNI